MRRRTSSGQDFQASDYEQSGNWTDGAVRSRFIDIIIGFPVSGQLPSGRQLGIQGSQGYLSGFSVKNRRLIVQSFWRFSDGVGQFVLCLSVFKLGLQQECLGLKLLRGRGINLRAQISALL